jgi:hypothetical protein
MKLKFFTDDRNSHYLFCFSLALISVIITYFFIITGKVYSADTALIFLNLITKEEFVFHTPSFRFSNFIIQLPALIGLKLNPITTDFDIQLIKVIYNLSYALFPLFFLYYFLYKYLKKPNDSFLLYPVFTYFYLYTITDNYSFNIACETVLWIWPAAYILERDVLRIRDFLCLLFFSTILLFSYESGVLCLFYLLVTHFKKFLSGSSDNPNKNLHLIISGILLIFTTAQTAHIIYLQSFHYDGHVFSFYQSLKDTSNPPLNKYFLPIFILPLLHFATKRYQRIFCYFLILAFLYLFFLMDINTKIVASLNFRTLIVPFVFVLLIFHHYLKIKISKILLLCIAISFGEISVSTSLAYQNRWSTLDSIQTDGIIIVKDKSDIKELYKNGYVEWSVFAEGLIHDGQVSPRRYFIHNLVKPDSFCHNDNTLPENWAVYGSINIYRKVFNFTNLSECK